MFTSNPFVELLETIPADAMQMYVVAMVILVIGGTILDMMHKKSAKYFFENSQKGLKNAKRTISGGEKVSMAVSTVTSEVLTSSEFENPARRISHLFTMYGFIIFVATTAIQIFASTPVAGIVSVLWHIGALMLCFGGYWFWFFIRANVSAEGQPWYRLTRADLFIVSLLATATFALIWSATQGSALGWLFFGLFLASSTVLFGGVLWSKFAHMFFKPAAAYQKKTVWADGSREGLPDIPDLSSAEVHERFPDIPTYMGKVPENMGPGIRREAAKHY